MFLTEVQQSVARFLAAHPYFAGDGSSRPIPVIAANDKALLAKADKAVLSLGCCVVVQALGGDYSAESGPAPYLSPGRFVCHVYENMIVNRAASGSGQPGELVAEVCAQLLKNHQPLDAAGSPLTGSGIVCHAITPNGEAGNLVAWDMVFHCDGGHLAEPVRRSFSAPPLPGAVSHFDDPLPAQEEAG